MTRLMRRAVEEAEKYQHKMKRVSGSDMMSSDWMDCKVCDGRITIHCGDGLGRQKITTTLGRVCPGRGVG